MMKEKIIRHSFVFGLLLACIFQFSLYSQATTLKNDLIAWGFKRGENHEQANLDSNADRIIRNYDGISMGNREISNIYLTFDCGYEAGYTESILNVLEKYNVNAAFFLAPVNNAIIHPQKISGL